MTVTATPRKPKSKTTKPSPVFGEEKSLMRALGEHELLSGNPLPELDHSNTIIDIHLDDIKPHTSNRDLSSDESIEELAMSIEQLGQLEPATVRECPNAQYTYELISGERRYRALQKLGRSTIRAIVIREDASNGLVRLAAANSQRRDLNAIERAELIVQLMKPITEGGSGLSRASAGQAVGLQSDSGVKNAIRMLRLPHSIRSMIVSGELSERAARRLVPFTDCKELIDDIANELKEPSVQVELATDDSRLPYEITDCIREHTRPLDSKEYASNDLVKNRYTRYPKLFTHDQELAANFSRHEFEIDGEKIVVTSDVKKWDDLQRPLAAAAWEKQAERNRSGSRPKAKVSAAAKLTSAQQAAEDKRREKEAAERLKRWTQNWQLLALRCQLADDIIAYEKRMLIQPIVQNWYRGDIKQLINIAYEENEFIIPKVDRYNPTVALPSGTADWTVDLFQLMLWPESTLAKKRNDRDAVVHAGVLPDLDSMGSQFSERQVLELAKYCNVTIADFWKDARNTPSAQNRLLEAWFTRHTTTQLQSLWRSMKLPMTKLNKRSELVAELMKRHHEDGLPLPKQFTVKELAKA